MPTPERAQSSLQFLLHFHRSGGSAQELRVLRDAYLLAMQLNSGLMTGGGKPTLTHNVGAASLAHHYGAPFDVVSASMLHDAYLVGDWGNLRPRINAENRAEVRATIGPSAEAYCYGFCALATRNDELAALAARSEPFTESERNVLRVKFFELLDHLLDLGSVLFFRNVEHARAQLAEQRTTLCHLVDRCGIPGLRADFELAIDLTLTSELPPELIGLTYPGNSIPLILPRSCQRRPSYRLGSALASAARRVARALQHGRGQI